MSFYRRAQEENEDSVIKKSKISANENSYHQKYNSFLQKRTNLLKLVAQVSLSLKSVKTGDPKYFTENGNLLDKFSRYFNLLNSALNFTSTSIPRIASLEDLPTPSEDSPIYKAFQNYQNTKNLLENNLTTELSNIKNIIQIIQNSKKNEQFFKMPDINNVERFLTNIFNLSIILGLHNSTFLSEPKTITAYPMMFDNTPKISIDLKKWREVGIKISSFERAYGSEYTFPQILYHFTKDWNMFERNNFKNWYKYNYKKASEEMNFKKEAFQHNAITDDSKQKFDKKKKLLISRVNLVRKILHDLIHSQLIDNISGNKILRILSALEFETLNLNSLKLLNARLNRVSKMLKKSGATECVEIIKRAQEEIDSEDPNKRTINLLRNLKKEMDSLSYSKHLDSLYNIKKDLEGQNRQSEADSILKIIKDELDGVDKLNKKLTEVYTDLSRIPISIEEPIEVSEEDISSMNKNPIQKPHTFTKPLIQQNQVRKPTFPIIERSVPNV